MVILFISRLFFIFINIDSAGYSGLYELIKILFFGARFDYTTIIYYNSVFIALSLLPLYIVNYRWYQALLKILFSITNSIIILFDLSDAIYFQFSNKRTTADIFSTGGIANDFINLLPSYVKDFWYVFVLWIGLTIIMILLYSKLQKWIITTSSFKKSGITKYIINFLIYIGLIVLLYVPARGIGLKPLRIISAVKYVSTDHIPFVLNTPFTIITTVSKEDISEKKYFSSKELQKLINIKKDYKHSLPFNSDNVVIIILESFGKEHIGVFNNYEGYTPFLDSLIDVSLNCTNAYANGKKSIDALPAILSSIPSLMTRPYITSQFASNKISGLGEILASRGYNTSFFHGGMNGTMGFDNFSILSGIENYYGLNEYPNKSDYDGNWGIYDEEFFQFFNNKLSEFQEPFFSCIFSLSSHHPYNIPEKYSNKFKGSTEPIHKSIEYADYSLKRFFNAAVKEDWFENTVFIITADHTSLSTVKSYKNSIGAYSIPLIIYKPGDKNLTGVFSPVVSQIDIMPSILDYLNYDKPFASFGNSIFDTNNNNYFAIAYRSGIYQFIKNDTVVKFDSEKYLSLYNLSNDKLLRHNLLYRGSKVSENIDQSLKAIIQEYNFRVKYNKLTID